MKVPFKFWRTNQNSFNNWNA